MESGELAERTFADYFATCQMLVDAFGRNRRVDNLRPDDFTDFGKRFAARHSLTSLGNHISRAETCFRYGMVAGVVAEPGIG